MLGPDNGLVVILALTKDTMHPIYKTKDSMDGPQITTLMLMTHFLLK